MNHIEISQPLLKTISKEFKYIVKKMRGTNAPLEKLFFYSAAYGLLSRIFNQEYNPLLVHMHMILQTSHNTINAKVQEITRGIEQVIKIPPVYFKVLEDIIEDLADKIEKKQDLCATLQRVSNLTYALIGNGYYLLQKGTLIL